MTDALRDVTPRKALRPRDAATLIIVDTAGGEPRVLLGRRRDDLAFMPGRYVFPGGRVDPADRHVAVEHDLAPGNLEKLMVDMKGSRSPARARALALAAVRETFEEAGLLLARPGPARPVAGPWRPFVGQGALPDLEALEVVARAITPPMVAKRFDTWFLVADAERLMSLERQPDCGELEEVAWVDFDEALELPLPSVTRSMIKEAVLRMEDPSRPKPFFRFRAGGMKPAFL
jgi:8-oxo-dGTP pyrophosphatase MutT (NUDIX family)